MENTVETSENLLNSIVGSSHSGFMCPKSTVNCTKIVRKHRDFSSIVRHNHCHQRNSSEISTISHRNKAAWPYFEDQDLCGGFVPSNHCKMWKFDGGRK
jgi:hypothetical protein